MKWKYEMVIPIGKCWHLKNGNWEYIIRRLMSDGNVVYGKYEFIAVVNNYEMDNRIFDGVKEAIEYCKKEYGVL